MRTQDIKMPPGYSIRRTIYGYVGALDGRNGPLWETGFDWNAENIQRKALAHHAETCADVDAAIAKATAK